MPSASRRRFGAGVAVVRTQGALVATTNLRTSIATALVLACVASAATAATVTVKAGDSLSVIADRAGVSQKALAAANNLNDANLVRIGQRLRLPVADTAAPATASAARGTSVHVVKSGETFSSIAARYNCNARILAKANGYEDPRKLLVGTRLLVPSVAGMIHVTAPAKVVATGLSTLPAPVRLTVQTPVGARAARGTYRVRSGDSLSAIATRFGLSTTRLARANGIADPSRLIVGRLLRIPTRSRTSTVASTPSVTLGRHRVLAGETLSQIAERQATTVGRLVSLNRLADVNAVFVGQVLRVPVARGSATPVVSTPVVATDASVRTHTVQAGDSLGSIALKASTGVAAIMRLNSIQDPNQIVVGTVLRLPEPTAPATSTSVRALIDREATARGVDPALARAVAWQESGFAQSMISTAGAIGVMQVLPATSDWAAKYIVGRPLDPTKVEDNVAAGIAYLQWLLKNAPDRRSAIAGYYQGLASVQAKGMLAETKQYVDNVVALTGRV